MKKSQTGSTHVVVITVLVVAVLGLLGFVFWQNFVNKPTITPQPAQLQSYSTEKAFVNDFYTQYISAGSINGIDTQKTNDLVAKYRVTTKSISGDFDAVLCSQNFPQSIKVSNGTKTTDGVAINIEEDWGNSAPTTVNVTVASDTQGMKIIVASCHV